MLWFVVASLASLLISPAIAGEAGGHWAFQPLRDAAPPNAQNPWIQNPVDAFILRRLQDEKLDPSPPATRRDFIRRTYLAMTGLLPSYDELAGWLDAVDEPDDRVAQQLVDRLLASPQFGVRWGRYWLDVARYSDTKGYAYAVEQPDFFHAWRYRDWVVNAINTDMPYDRFIELQLAADRLLLLGDCATSDLAAMGFLTLGRRFLGVEQDIIDDRIDVVTRGALGLTVACARCHDHKFDPVPASDYYALYGIFKSSREWLAPLSSEVEQDAELDQLLAELKVVFNREADAVEKSFLERAEEYLVASLDLSKVPRPAFTEIVLPDAVNPAQIRRWHEYLGQSDKKANPVFAPWKALEMAHSNDFSAILEKLSGQNDVNPIVVNRLAEAPVVASMGDVAIRYATLFKEAANNTSSGVAWDEIRTVMRAPDSPFVIPRTHPHDVEWLFHNTALNAVKTAYANVERRIVALSERANYTIALEDRPTPLNMPVLLRGDYCTQGEEVPRASLSLLPNRQRVLRGSGRLELARSITDPANPLTARVMVNRIWHHYFGKGLVNTTSDFGLRADPPSHSELLDYLACRLIENDWSLKSIHRLIATSATFRQRADVSVSADPDNRLLAHFPRQRLDFESMRDGLLAASGELDSRLDGVPGELLGRRTSPRRSIYGRIDRKFLPTTLQVFDFANPELHSPGRYETNVPQQALFFLNSPFTIERARALVRTIAEGSPEARVRAMFRAVYQRDPTTEQLAASLEFISDSSSVAEPEIEQVSAAARAWQYGYGKIDDQKGTVVDFQMLPHFDGVQWSGGVDWPDPKLGWVRLTADGGHVGNSTDHAAIRRWIAPRDAEIHMTGAIEKIQDCGDGIRAWILGAEGSFGAWQVEFGNAARTDIDWVTVRAGDTIDFAVDCGEKGDFSCDGFRWMIEIESRDSGGNPGWAAARDFAGTVKRPEPLTIWERFAHALLLSNEFIFVD
ncbi:MAG: DUF1549 and DUF1553 domain-containing protein [Verrucomicrobiales bacterium]